VRASGEVPNFQSSFDAKTGTICVQTGRRAADSGHDRGLASVGRTIGTAGPGLMVRPRRLPARSAAMAFHSLRSIDTSRDRSGVL
jgi:hypothetical protein